MLNWLKKWRTTEEERQEERITAYVDDALTAVEKRTFEQEMGADDALRQAVEAERALKTTLAQLPRLRAPRNFTLDTAVYAHRPRSTFALDWYPRLRTATAVVGILLVGILALNLLTPPAFEQAAAPMAQEVALMEMDEEVSEQETLRIMPEADEPEAAGDAAADSALFAVEEAEVEVEEESAAVMADETAPAAPPAEMSSGATAITSTENAESMESAPITEGEGGAAADTLPALAPTIIIIETTTTPLPTAVVLPPPEPEPTSMPSFSLWQISQLSLLILFLSLLAATLITRRRL